MYRMYIDEVGHDDLDHVEDLRYRYLSLSGVIMEKDYARDHATPTLNILKSEIFKNDPEEDPIWLHRKDIMNLKGPFGVLSNDALRIEFDDRLIAYLTATEFKVVTAVIDKLEMMNQAHWENRHPYHYLMEILVEKFTKWLRRYHTTGDIMPEKRRGSKDPALQAAFDSIRVRGTRFESPENICGRIPSSKLKFREKKDNITGLQICDLLAHASHTYIRREQQHQVTTGPFSERVIPILTGSKYDRSPWLGTIKGYGTKYLP
jgi:hypothetical protein